MAKIKQMKPLSIFFLTIFTAVLIIYTIPATRQKAIQPLSYSECNTPLQYKIGSIDQRFGLSQDEASNDIKTTADLWSTAEGKKLFVYSPEATLTINFVYDRRQALDTQISQLDTKLNENSMTLKQQINDYQAQVLSFEQRLAEFKKVVNKYNHEGGAPPAVYDELNKQSSQLQAEGDALNARARQLNLSANDYNAGVSILNQDINQLNVALAKKPEEGIYDSRNNTLTIYFANNRQELLHTLAHEFGHSLGMDHVSDTNAIMYPYTTSSLVVTPDDLQQLNYVCRDQSSFVHWTVEFDRWFAAQLQSFEQTFSNGMK